MAHEPAKPHRLSAIREAAIVAELNQAADEYRGRRQAFEIERQRFEAARERFGAVQRLAYEILPGREWHEWEEDNRDVSMVAMDIGNAIQSVLQSEAYRSADEAALDPKIEFNPWMSSWTIARALDEQGFPFRTGTPRREVHAALLHLKGIKRRGNRRPWSYAYEDADTIFIETKAHYDRSHGSG